MDLSDELNCLASQQTETLTVVIQTNKHFIYTILKWKTLHRGLTTNSNKIVVFKSLLKTILLIML